MFALSESIPELEVCIVFTVVTMQRFEKTKIDFNFPKAVATLNG
jgi:hypothetical protein